MLEESWVCHIDLDLSKISMDDLVPTTPIGGDIISEESDDFAHTEEKVPKDDGMVIAQPVLDGIVALSVLSAEDPPTKDVKNSFALDAPST